ncbi:hypothetical protein M2361_003702 [Achromobacter sp. JUb104]|nr:hypothetical protein [Achromobacter sp. JUb104]
MPRTEGATKVESPHTEHSIAQYYELAPSTSAIAALRHSICLK